MRFCQSIPIVILLVLLLALVGKSGSPATQQAQNDRRGSIPDSYPIMLPNKDVPKTFGTIIKAAETQGIRIMAEVNRANSMSAPIKVRLTLKNGRDEDASFNHVFDESDFYLYLVDQDGKAVPTTPAGDEWLGASLYVQTMNPGMVLHPGQAVSRIYDLKQFFVIDHPGPYSVEVVRTVNGTTSYPQARRELEVGISSLVFGISK